MERKKEIIIIVSILAVVLVIAGLVLGVVLSKPKAEWWEDKSQINATFTLQGATPQSITINYGELINETIHTLTVAYEESTNWEDRLTIEIKAGDKLIYSTERGSVQGGFKRECRNKWVPQENIWNPAVSVKVKGKYNLGYCLFEDAEMHKQITIFDIFIVVE